jgi:uncharacterized protein involved in tolerance to divalent cations
VLGQYFKYDWIDDRNEINTNFKDSIKSLSASSQSQYIESINKLSKYYTPKLELLEVQNNKYYRSHYRHEYANKSGMFSN